MIVSHLLLILHKKIQFYIFMFEAWNVSKGRKVQGGRILSQGTVDSVVYNLTWDTLPQVGKTSRLDIVHQLLFTKIHSTLILLYNGLATCSSHDWHIFLKIFVINVFVLYHPSTRYSSGTNLHLQPKPAGRSLVASDATQLLSIFVLYIRKWPSRSF